MPLNGNLNTQGLSDFTVTKESAVTVDSSGKIGQCYSFANDGKGISINNNFIDLLGTSYSATAWVNPVGNHLQYNGPIISSGNWNSSCWSFGLSQNNSQVDVMSPGYNKYITCSVPTNTWTHLACCMSSDGVCKLYKNGEYVGSTTVSSSALRSDASNTTIGRASYTTYFGFNGKINDVRLYNHCLSEKEIKEISKGLVLHYPLNGSAGCGSNLLLKSNRYIHTTSYAMADYYFVSGEAPVNGQTYTIQLKGELGEGRAYFGIYNSGGSASNTSLSSAQLVNGIYTRTFTWSVSSSSNTYLRVYHMPSSATSYSTIEWVKLEPGSVATPYCLNHTEDDDGNVVHDCSGYGYNGTITGILTTSSDSARYNLSTYTSSGDTNYITTPTLHLPGDQITMTYWFKSSNKSPGNGYHEPFNDGITYELGMSGSGYLRAGLYVNGTRYVADGTSSKLTDGSWHMCTMTYDGTTIKRYVDAVMEKSTTVSGTLATSGYFVLGHLLTSSDYCSKETYTSDVRLYTTALSESDIKELYETGQSIDNKGNIYAYEFKEE